MEQTTTGAGISSKLSFCHSMAAQVRAINERCKEHGVPQPVSFAYPCNAIAKEALPVLKDLGKNFTLTAAQAKLESGRLAVRSTEEAVQIHGGYGYIEEYPVCRFYRDAKILTIGEGTDEVQQMVIARALGA